MTTQLTVALIAATITTFKVFLYLSIAWQELDKIPKGTREKFEVPCAT